MVISSEKLTLKIDKDSDAGWPAESQPIDATLASYFW